MKKLRIAIIGNGGICRGAHLPAWTAMEDVEIVALCDIKPEKSKALAQQFGLDVKIYEDYKELIEKETLDAVDICTPNYLHPVIAVYAFEHGLNVFSEKPDAPKAADAIAMKEAADKAGKLLMVMRNNRYWNTSKYLKKFIEEGKMGNIYAGRCGWQRTRGIPGRGGWFTTKAQSGGGPLIDLGVHMIDLAIWLMGNPTPVAVTGCTYNVFADRKGPSDSVHAAFGEAKEDGTFDVEDLAMGFIKFDNGACLQIEFSWASNVDKEDHYVELRGTEAGSSWHSAGGNKLHIYAEDNGTLIDYDPRISNDFGKGLSIHGQNLRHFADCLLYGAEPKFKPQEGINMIKILNAIYQSAETGKEVLL